MKFMKMKEREGLSSKLKKVYTGCVHCFSIAQAMLLDEKIASKKELAQQIKLQMKTCGSCAEKTRELLLELDKNH